MDRAEFLANRRKGIGGSDIACLVGQNPYKTAFELWYDKTQALDKEVDPDAEERMYWGLELEKLIAERYRDKGGEKRGYKYRIFGRYLPHMR